MVQDMRRVAICRVSGLSLWGNDQRGIQAPKAVMVQGGEYSNAPVEMSPDVDFRFPLLALRVPLPAALRPSGNGRLQAA
jgi:hypothetical protein